MLVSEAYLWAMHSFHRNSSNSKQHLFPDSICVAHHWQIQRIKFQPFPLTLHLRAQKASIQLREHNNTSSSTPQDTGSTLRRTSQSKEVFYRLRWQNIRFYPNGAETKGMRNWFAFFNTISRIGSGTIMDFVCMRTDATKSRTSALVKLGIRLHPQCTSQTHLAPHGSHSCRAVAETRPFSNLNRTPRSWPTGHLPCLHTHIFYRPGPIGPIGPNPQAITCGQPPSWPPWSPPIPNCTIHSHKLGPSVMRQGATTAPDPNIVPTHKSLLANANQLAFSTLQLSNSPVTWRTLFTHPLLIITV